MMGKDGQCKSSDSWLNLIFSLFFKQLSKILLPQISLNSVKTNLDLQDLNPGDFEVHKSSS